MAKRPMYLQHVNVYVRNAERSKEWYEDLLGLHVYDYRPGWAAFMSADEEQSHEVALMQLGDDAPLQQRRPGRAEPHGVAARKPRRPQGILRAHQGTRVSRSTTSPITASRSASTCATLTATASRCSTNAAGRMAGRLPHLFEATWSAAAASPARGTPRWSTSSRCRNRSQRNSEQQPLTLPRLAARAPPSPRKRGEGRYFAPSFFSLSPLAAGESQMSNKVLRCGRMWILSRAFRFVEAVGGDHAVDPARGSRSS